MHKTLVVLLVAAVLAVAGCGNKPKPDASAGASSQSGANTSGEDWTPASDTGEGAEVPGPQEGLLAKRIVYFDFDSSEIRGEGTAIIAAHAKHLASTKGLRVRLEGHTDERGEAAYNQKLSIARAKSVMDYLTSKGVPRQRLSHTGFGASRPVVDRSDPRAYLLNRRV